MAPSDSVDIEIAALVDGLERLWQRAGLPFDNGLFWLPDLSEADKNRLHLAGRLAAGGRFDNKAANDRNPLLLQSIFDGISLGEQNSPTGLRTPKNFLKVEAQRVEPPNYPQANQKASQGDYRSLCESLVKPARALRPIADYNPAAYLEGLYWLLARFTSNIPAAPELSDVSMFDQHRITAAIGTCLRLLDDSVIKRLLGMSVFDKQLAVGHLLGGDISGVQDFIYNVKQHEGAARSLRGRSFYLQLLTEAAQRFVMRRLGLPITSVIYSGGAHFFLLIPPTSAEQLPDLRRDITTILFQHHQRDLYLALGTVPLTAADFAEGKLADRRYELHSMSLGQAKRRRYTELALDDQYAAMFQPLASSSDAASKQGGMYWKLGRDLPDTGFIHYGVGEPGAVQSDLSALAALGLDVRLDNNRSAMSERVDYVVRLALDDDAVDKGEASQAWPDAPITVRGVRYTVNLVPDKDFDALAKIETFRDSAQRPHGIQRLGILRMDVDNLGKIFQKGLGKHATLTRIAALSRTLCTFFEGRVAVLCRQIEQDYGQQCIYAVYAGGDDVFIVGPWHLMPRLARLIRAELEMLTNDHPDLHISAGIAAVGATYPLYQAADDAHQSLEKAKARDGKDSITFLDETMPWSAADNGLNFDIVERWSKRMIDLGIYHENQFPMGLLGRLMTLELMHRDSHRETDRHGGKAADQGRWVWLGVYQLHRLKEQYQKNGNSEVVALIGDLLIEAQRDKFIRLPTLGLAARWAHLTLRRSQEHSNLVVE
ncbi:MAG: type III-A CRISPR-associated protein Cas10/Csm1 [Aggregatilineales bacterium]